MDALEILTDAANRPREAADALRGTLTAEQANAHPLGHPNSIAWLLWHSGREIDVQLAALSGGAEVWSAGGWAKRTGLGAAGAHIGYGHSEDEARAIRVEDPALLLDYLEETLTALLEYLHRLDAGSLGEVVDDQWDPPVTRGARLVSIIDDAVQHLAQARYVAGMPQVP
ncbi:MAG: DinB family protein [Brachybacterium sp.]|nr:DinB family protein [Brachybacterium sp.]